MYKREQKAPRRSRPAINRKPLGLLRSCTDRLSTLVLRSVSVRRSGKPIGRVSTRRFPFKRKPPLSSGLIILSLPMILMRIRIQQGSIRILLLQYLYIVCQANYNTLYCMCIVHGYHTLLWLVWMILKCRYHIKNLYIKLLPINLSRVAQGSLTPTLPQIRA